MLIWSDDKYTDTIYQNGYSAVISIKTSNIILKYIFFNHQDLLET